MGQDKGAQLRDCVDRQQDWFGRDAANAGTMSDLSSLLVTMALTLMGLATLLGVAVHVLLRRRKKDEREWAESTAEALSSLGHPFAATSNGQMRGTVAGRTVVLARSIDKRVVAVVSLHLPLEHTDGKKRPSLRLPSEREGHQFGTRWVQVWAPVAEVAQTPALLARALSVAAAAEEQQAAPWALFAGQRGLDFRGSRHGEPCLIEGTIQGVPVQVHLDGVNKPPMRTVIVAGVPRNLRVTAVPGPMSLDLAGLLQKHADAEVSDGTVRLHFPGMLVDQLDERIGDAVALARAFASSARG